MNVNIKVVAISDDDLQWIAPVDFESLRDFYKDPRRWVKEHVNSTLPAPISFDTVDNGDIPDGMPAQIAGIAHVEPDGTSITMRITVGIDRKSVRGGAD